MSESSLPVELWPIERLIPYEKNAKIHPDDQIESLMKSIQTFGWTQPIVVDKDGIVIVGHGRRLAALKLGLKHVPVVCRTDLTKAEADALRLADNRVSSQHYDTDLLKIELLALKDVDFDLSLTGFDPKELDFLTSDLSKMDVSVFVEDVGGAVEEQKAKNEAKIKEIDEKEIPISEGFGFGRLRPGQIRRVKAFMARVEDETGHEGPEALMAFLDEMGIAA